LGIPPEPILSVSVGLFTILALVLILPFKFKVIEENLEAFFFLMGILAITISNVWSYEIVKDALKAPISIGGLPIGIFQVVLIAGLTIYFFNKQIYKALFKLLNRLGFTFFTFIFVFVLGLISSLISVIVTAVILAEIIAALPLKREKKIELTVLTCFSVGMGAALTPVGEPLSTIAVSNLRGPPYYAGFLFLFRMLGIYIIPGIFILALFTSYRMKKLKFGNINEIPEYTETLRRVIIRAFRVYLFVAALIFLGHGLSPLVFWYFSKVPPEVLYWINMISAVLDNATLTAAEIGPALTYFQIKSALLALLISGGILIPGNIPNIVAAGRLRISSKEWAKIGFPVGVTIMLIYFIILLLERVCFGF